MKKIFGITVCLLLVCICAFALADVEINETNFPDDNFRAYVVDWYDSDEDGMLSDAELENVTTILCGICNIVSGR